MKPYEIDIEKLAESKKITDEQELLKLRLAAEFVRVTRKMKSQEIVSKTGLDKADLSRLRTGNIERFGLGRIIGLLRSLGYTTQVKVTKSREAS